ncbi:IFI30 (predicted) [Pycnogonum litorale]
MATQVKFMYCLDSNSPVTSGEMCATKLRLSGIWDKISSCAKSSLGNKLTHMAAVKTNQLNPPHQWVPWIVIDGNAVEVGSIQAFVKAVCDKYEGKRPSACTQSAEITMKSA